MCAALTPHSGAFVRPAGPPVLCPRLVASQLTGPARIIRLWTAPVGRHCRCVFGRRPPRQRIRTAGPPRTVLYVPPTAAGGPWPSLPGFPAVSHSQTATAGGPRPSLPGVPAVSHSQTATSCGLWPSLPGFLAVSHSQTADRSRWSSCYTNF